MAKNLKNGKEIIEKIESLLEKEDDGEELIQMAKDNPNYLYTYVEIKSREIGFSLCKMEIVVLTMARALSEIKENEINRRF